MSPAANHVEFYVLQLLHLHYSNLSASIGSRRDAFQAG